MADIPRTRINHIIRHSENKNFVSLKMRESEVKAAMSKIINGTADRSSFQDSQRYVTFLFSGWRIEAVLA